MGRPVAALVALVTAILLIGASPAAAEDDGDPLRISVTVNGQEISGREVHLVPGQPVELAVTATNAGSIPQNVRIVRVSGVALALTFFRYDTTVPFEVPARSRVTRSLPLDVRDLDGQAVGLLPTSVELLTEDRRVLGSAHMVADVRGSFWSVYGVFGIAMLALTALAWASALLALARHRLPANRFRRALRFLPAGIGTGLVAVVSLSVLRLVAPEPAVEVPVVIGAAVIAMVLGFLTPRPLSVTDPPDPAWPADDKTTAALVDGRADTAGAS